MDFLKFCLLGVWKKNKTIPPKSLFSKGDDLPWWWTRKKSHKKKNSKSMMMDDHHLLGRINIRNIAGGLTIILNIF